MSLQKRVVIADLLFAVQIVCTLLFGGSQFLRMLTTAQGVSLSWFACWEAFLVINLALALRAHKTSPSRVTVQTILSYVTWVIVVAADLGVMVYRGTGTWIKRDTDTVIFVAVGVVCVLGIATFKKLTIADPIVKGYLALFFKAVPQFAMAYNILLVGGAGLAGITIIAGHITVLTRLGQLVFSMMEASWDRNRTGSAISEAGNELSWIAVNIVWFLV